MEGVSFPFLYFTYYFSKARHFGLSKCMQCWAEVTLPRSSYCYLWYVLGLFLRYGLILMTLWCYRE